MVLDILKGVEDMDKAKEEKQEADLKEKAKAASTGQSVNHMKQTNRLVTLIVAI
jgi:hypothetical protein